MPVAGSAYTFSYASLGELVAWIIGWDLILELALGASTVAVGWSNYFADVMKEAGITIPDFAYGDGHNLVAAAIVLILTAVICVGIKISSQVNFVFVVIKVSIVLLVIVAGAFFIKLSNYSPFIPPSGSQGAAGAEATPSLLQDLGFAPGAFGISGIFAGAALVFFAYIGFDIVATAAEETKKPQRDMPIGRAARGRRRARYLVLLEQEVPEGLRGLPRGRRRGRAGRRGAGRPHGAARAHAYLAFAKISTLFHPPREASPGVAPEAVVHPSARVHPSAQVMPLASIGPGAEIGPRTIVYPGRASLPRGRGSARTACSTRTSWCASAASSGIGSSCSRAASSAPTASGSRSIPTARGTARATSRSRRSASSSSRTTSRLARTPASIARRSGRRGWGAGQDRQPRPDRPQRGGRPLCLIVVAGRHRRLDEARRWASSPQGRSGSSATSASATG